MKQKVYLRNIKELSLCLNIISLLYTLDPSNTKFPQLNIEILIALAFNY